MRKAARMWGLPAVILSAVLAVGCGASPAEVTGRITYKGRAVQSGSVLILGTDGIPHYATLGQDGRYTVADARSGSVRLAVASPSPQAGAALESKKEAARRKRKKGKTASAPVAAPAANTSDWFPLPERYGDPNQSGLNKELRPGPNTIDLDLD